MKPKTLFILAALAAGGYAFWRYLMRPKSELDLELAEGKALAAKGRINAEGTNAAKPPYATLDNRGPLDGAVYTVWDLLQGKDITQKQTYRPNMSGDSAGSLSTEYWRQFLPGLN